MPFKEQHKEEVYNEPLFCQGWCGGRGRLLGVKHALQGRLETASSTNPGAENKGWSRSRPGAPRVSLMSFRVYHRHDTIVSSPPGLPSQAFVKTCHTDKSIVNLYSSLGSTLRKCNWKGKPLKKDIHMSEMAEKCIFFEISTVQRNMMHKKRRYNEEEFILRSLLREFFTPLPLRKYLLKIVSW